MVNPVSLVVGAGLVASAGADFGGGLSLSEAKRIRERRNAPPPTSPDVETRQMRRARERAEAKAQPHD